VPSKISAKNTVLAPLRALREIVLPRIHEFFNGEKMRFRRRCLI